MPLFGFWTAWARVLSQVPVVVRLALGLFIIFIPARWLIETLGMQPTLFVRTPSDSFEPFLVTVGISAIVMTLLLPQTRSVQQNQGLRRR